MYAAGLRLALVARCVEREGKGGEMDCMCSLIVSMVVVGRAI